MTERELIIAAQGGDIEARNALIMENIGLIKSWVKGYIRYDLTIDDLTSWGVIGFSRAIMKFDLQADNQLAAYAKWAVRSTLNKVFKRRKKECRGGRRSEPEEVSNDSLLGFTEMLKGFDEREQQILILRYRDNCTLKEIGTVLGVSTGRVGQLQDNILRRLRRRCK